jgi:hypothetical protein
MSLFGIESEDDCREKIDELLELHHSAETANSKEAIDALKSALRDYYRKADTLRGSQQMSPVEQQWFWPAIQEAYVKGPKLNSRQTWNDGLYNVEYYLRYYRPTK